MLPIRSTLSPAPDDTNASGRPSPLGVPALPSYSNFYLSSDEIITPLISDIAFPSVNPPIVLYLNPSFKDSFDGKDDANMENLPGGRVKRLRNLTQAQVKAINSDQTNGHNKKNILKVVAETKIVYHVWIEDGEATEGGDKEVENIEAAQSNKTTGNEVAVKGSYDLRLFLQSLILSPLFFLSLVTRLPPPILTPSRSPLQVSLELHLPSHLRRQ